MRTTLGAVIEVPTAAQPVPTGGAVIDELLTSAQPVQTGGGICKCDLCVHVRVSLFV